MLSVKEIEKEVEQQDDFSKSKSNILEMIKQAIKDNIASASNSMPDTLHCHAEYLNALVGAYRTFN